MGGILTNCTLTANFTGYYGGGAYGDGTTPLVLNNCLISSNLAEYGGGVSGSSSVPYNSTNCVLNNCTIVSNFAAYYGGGAAFATLNGCTISGNRVTNYFVYSYGFGGGGGVEGGILNNCVIAGNRSPGGAGADSGVRPGGILINCILSNNIALNGPSGGAAFASLNNCSLISNFATNGSGGAAGCTLSNCILFGNISHSTTGGGGAASSTLINCMVVSNSALGVYYNPNPVASGGGTLSSSLINCILAFNSAQTNGGGDSSSTLVNCTVVSNSAPTGGGVFNSTVENSVIYYNNGGNYFYNSGGNSYRLHYCCIMPLTNGPGNFTNNPGLVNLAGGDFHLQPNSPCINSGDNSYVTATTDFDGNPRIVGGTVDVGAYEYQTPSSILSYAWAQQYGLPTDGSVDYLDLDGTGMENWQKSIAGLNPTNPASVLAMLPPLATNDAAGVTVSWQSVNARMYYLQRATNLTLQPAFSAVQSNLLGQAGTTSFTDTTATNAGPYFYRVGVQ